LFASHPLHSKSKKSDLNKKKSDIFVLKKNHDFYQPWKVAMWITVQEISNGLPQTTCDITNGVQKGSVNETELSFFMS